MKKGNYYNMGSAIDPKVTSCQTVKLGCQTINAFHFSVNKFTGLDYDLYETNDLTHVLSHSPHTQPLPHPSCIQVSE